MSLAVVDEEKLRVIKEAVYTRFQNFLKNRENLSPKEMKAFSRTIWRIGELHISEATQDLITLAKTCPDDEVTAYSIVWSLGRIGDPAGIEALSALSENAKALFSAAQEKQRKEKAEAKRLGHYYYDSGVSYSGLSIIKICHEVRYWLTPENERADLLDNYIKELPSEILEVLMSPEQEAKSAAIQKYLHSILVNNNNENIYHSYSISIEGFIVRRDLHIAGIFENSDNKNALLTIIQELEEAGYFIEGSENRDQIKNYLLQLLEQERIGETRYQSRHGGFAEFVQRTEGSAVSEPQVLQPPSCVPCLASDTVNKIFIDYLRTIDTSLIRHTNNSGLINFRFLYFALKILRNEKNAISELNVKEEQEASSVEPVEDEKTDDSHLVIETLYLLSLNNPTIRQALFTLVSTLELTGNSRKSAFRTLWKMAEFREDHEFYAHIIHTLEKNKTTMQSYAWNSETGYQRGLGSSVPYFSRRSWRTLNKLGQISALSYIDSAEAILLTMTDEDAVPVETQNFSAYYWETRETRRWSVTNSEYTNFQAFSSILYTNSNKYEKSASGPWVIKDINATDSRTEAFPEIWDQVPDRLFNLLIKSKCEAVHTFAAKALKDNAKYLDSISAEQWFELLVSKYEQTALLALKALQQYFADKDPDTRLIQACLTSPFKPVRNAGMEWLQQASYILRDNLELLAWLVMSEDPDLREASLEYVYVLDARSDLQQDFLELLLGKLFALGEDADKDIVENASWVLLKLLKPQLSIVTFEAVGMFVSHASPYVSLLGAQMLSAQNLKPHEIPPELYGQLFNSSSPEVRAEAVSLMNNLEDAELAQWDEMLGNLMLSPHAPVRAEAGKLIARAVKVDEEFTTRILQKLISALFKSETAEGLHEDLFNLFNDELRSSWNLIDKNQLWRMLTAKSKGVQRVSAAIIQTRPNSDYTVRQWATLCGNPSIGVRAWAWKAYETELDQVKANIDDALHIFSSNWEDSRSFGFNYFSKNFPFDQWSEEQVIALCDNRHAEVQELGRNLVFEHIQVDRGPRYLLALSEHPSVTMQKFIGQFLERLAAGNNEEIFRLEQYFASVLTRVNKGRVAKDQVLNFLHQEGLRDRKIADLVANIMQHISLSAAIYDKAKAIEIMSDLNSRYPGLAMPVKAIPLQVRGYQNNNDMQEAGQ
ncbi:MAG: HEAT repeat domain-containing protein [Methyloligellaceae bacterium]